ncbi:hypothetical protein E2C01_025959 [Portunus trituberculatus]|uniref:Uncharacterized protein n=1 Tax=Portunus trituberculatus TaxID=210409 RepID=A0A5B7EH48_PORTR|nr:hypothetical protein [Portunus trituberculatus]
MVTTNAALHTHASSSRHATLSPRRGLLCLTRECPSSAAQGVTLAQQTYPVTVTSTPVTSRPCGGDPCIAQAQKRAAPPTSSTLDAVSLGNSERGRERAARLNSAAPVGRLTFGRRG